MSHLVVSFLALFSFLFSQHIRAEEYQLSIVAVFRDEAPYLKEWIEFHRIVGVEHFYLINHMSVDHFQDVLQPYIDAGIVDLDNCDVDIKTNDWNELQQKLCYDAISKVRKQTNWIAIIDVDEFLFPVIEDNLVNFLKQYDPYGGLMVNRQMYGTSNIKKLEPGELLTERLTWKGKENYFENLQAKFIVKAKRVDLNKQSFNILHFKNGLFSVNENFQKTNSSMTESVSVNKIRINHYWTRDIQYLYSKKIPSLLERSNGLQKEINKAIEREASTHAVEDTCIHRFLPQLKERMNSPMV